MPVAKFAPLIVTSDLRKRLREALSEDIGPGDVTTRAVVNRPMSGRAVIIARQDAIVCGLPVVEQIFLIANRKMQMKRLRSDGDRVAKGERVFEVCGNLAAILTAERVALNFLQRLSGIATLTRRYVEAAGGIDGPRILDTRKTTPLWRDLERYAVRVGGGVNHRFGLFDMVLIKNNHSDVAGGLAEAIGRVKRAQSRGKRLAIGVEARNIEEVRVAVAERADLIMLDNMTRSQMRRALSETPSTIATEASGRMTPRRVRSLAGLPLQRISVGALTHSAPAVDFALRYAKP
ncbi:carboxylating nicotinate-nucleotide diphosphorylase [Candidatus Sumerlaeota bacterium]|nr:carboxylating nicotinate-nucleotide diphosphorylase [Candidatus Sumerlaeota bacterium]